ncbi:hypothetical protein [Dinoroseobacter sp. S124A]|uniref:hypothetical protein n=1 Tax=Dinoroseobacter sp. S124A TaxID=3415128 RepID=UPI003C7B1471
MNVLSLEDFLDTPQSTHHTAAASQAAQNGDLESSRLAGYESGYQAGWDDALKSSEMEHTHISAEFARNLEELSFTFLEARRQVCLSLKPLVETLVRQVVPELMQSNYKELLEELLLPIVEAQSQATVDLICAPEDEDMMKRLLAGQDRLPVVLRTESSFSQGQVRFCLGHEIHDVDASGLLTQIKDAASAFYANLDTEQAHG